MTRINVAQQGADTTGSEPIDPILDTHNNPNTEFYFPNGRYKIKNFATDHANIQFRGNNATLVPTKRTSMANWFELHSDGFVMDGFEWDLRDCPYPPRFHLWGDNWRVRNISVKGHCGTNGKDMNIHGVSFLRGWVTSEDGTGVWQNIYLQDGSGPPGARTNRRGFLIEGDEQKGHMVFDNVWMEQWGENTIYANNHPGRLTLKNCFFRNTNVGVRVGGRTTIKGCTFVRNYDEPLQRQGWSGGANMRGIRVEADDEHAYPGELLIKDCDFKFFSPSNFENAAGGNAWASRPPIEWKAPCEAVAVEDCRIRYDGFHGSPVDKNKADGAGGPLKRLGIRNAEIDHRGFKDYCALSLEGSIEKIGEISGTTNSKAGIVSGVDTETSMKKGTPKQASESSPMASPPAVGESPGSPPDGHLLVIDASETGRVDYKFEVSGSVEKSPEFGASLDDADKINGKAVSGWADNWIDSYRFTGEIRSMSVKGDPRLFFEPESAGEVSVATVSDLLEFTETNMSGSARPEGAKILVIDAQGTDPGAKSYRFSVTGEIEPAPKHGTFNPGYNDSIKRRVAEGNVNQNKDAYYYTGEIESFECEGNPTLLHAGPGDETPRETTAADLTASAEDVSDEEASAFTKSLIAFLKRHFG